MPHVEKMPLKAFWDAVEKRLSACSADELRAILRVMAQETPPTGRQAFLGKLKPVTETAAAVEAALRQEDLLADIADLVGEIKERAKHADDWEEDHGWDDDGDYGDEDSLGPYDEFVEPLTELFDRAEAAFDYGKLPLARAAYQKLFDEALQFEDDYGRGVGTENLTEVDIGEARARYLRAVYETARPVNRPQALFERMRQARAWLPRPRSTLDDLIQISPKPLPDQKRFLEDWIAFLRDQSGHDADAWLREAIRLSHGTPGLEELARAEGKKRPRAYLDWFAALEAEGKHREVLAAAQGALKTLRGKLPIRAAIADHLCAAAAKLNETEALRAGRWEAFVVKPTLSRLLDLWDTAPIGKERTTVMRQAAGRAQEYLAHPPRHQEALDVWSAEDNLEASVWIDKSVLAHAYLLTEDWEAAHQLAAREKELGWSSSDNPQGLVVALFLALLSGKSPGALPSNLAQIWEWGLEHSAGFGHWEEENGKGSELKRLGRAYADLFSHLSLSKGEQEAVLSWCLEVAQRRVDAIVSNQHRGSYDKAAVLIAACAETLRQRGKSKDADAILDEVRQRFPRHRAFLSELDAATGHVKRNRR